MGTEIGGARRHDRAGEQPENPAPDQLQRARLLRLGIAPADSLSERLEMLHPRQSCDARLIWRNSRARQGKDISVVPPKREDFLPPDAKANYFLAEPGISGRPALARRWRASRRGRTIWESDRRLRWPPRNPGLGPADG